MSLKPQQQNAFLKKAISKYEREVKIFNKLINNRIKIKQLFLILCDITGESCQFEILRDNDIQKQLKTELLHLIDRSLFSNCDDRVKEFDKRYIAIRAIRIPLNYDLDNSFDTDLAKSIFNQVSIEDANSIGEVFFQEYQNFHGYKLIEEKVIEQIRKTKEVYIMPEIDFD
jgi:hypothetical protein